MKSILEIDGERFDTLEGFYEEVSRRLIPGADWGRNLDAFDEILEGGFGTPDGGFVLVWKNHERSREMLGYDETVRQLHLNVGECHPTDVPYVKAELAAAERHQGLTVFDWLVELIKEHGPVGRKAEDGIDLLLC